MASETTTAAAPALRISLPFSFSTAMPSAPPSASAFGPALFPSPQGLSMGPGRLISESFLLRDCVCSPSVTGTRLAFLL